MSSQSKSIVLLLALTLTLALTGCSGINASHSVSPATFLLPGLMKVSPAPAAPTVPPAESKEVAFLH